MQELKDIRGLVDIPDYTVYLWWLLALILVVFIVFLLLKFLKKPMYKITILSKKELAFKALKDLNFSDTKDVVYTFTQNFAYFDNSDEINEFVKNLSIYKYKKDTPNLSSSDKEYIQNFIDGIKL